MSSILRYLVILQSAGLPMYANSFDFPSDEACQSFNQRLSRDKGKLELLGPMFSAIKDFTGEVVADPLHCINVGFESFCIIGVGIENILFLGIFEIDSPRNDNLVASQNIIERIAESFFKKYPKKLLNKPYVNREWYCDFTEEIMKLQIPTHRTECRDCLTKCVSENKGCIPHILYFGDANKQES